MPMPGPGLSVQEAIDDVELGGMESRVLMPLRSFPCRRVIGPSDEKDWDTICLKRAAFPAKTQLVFFFLFSRES